MSMTNWSRKDKSRVNFRLIGRVLAFTLLVSLSMMASAKKCLYISSYHQGYAWSDGVERGVRSSLAGHCELRQFDMDTKRKKAPEEIAKQAQTAKAMIESWRPDVVIAADDNAAKHLIQPFYKDGDVPFVFCGVNWTAEEYGFPYSNVTGMVEVAPIKPLLQRAMEMAGGNKALYLGANTLTETKNSQRFAEAAAMMNIEFSSVLAESTQQWLEGYREAQAFDFIILGSNSGIVDWDDATIQAELSRVSRRFSVSNHLWMMPYAMFGLTKVAEEQGEWAGAVAIDIMQGTSPSDIPIVANRKWDVWINEPLMQSAEITVPAFLKRKAKRIR